MKKTNYNYCFTLVFFFVFHSVFVNGQEKSNYAEKLTTTQWKTNDIIFNLSKNLDSPIDIVFGAEFVHESGSTVNIPGFYNDNNEYVLRFSLPKTGKWRYTTYSTCPELSGLESEITAENNSKSDRHGSISISEQNKQKFIYADSSPYFAISYELDWLFALDYENETDIPKTRNLLRVIKSSGFNQIVMNVFAYSANMMNTETIPENQNFNKPDAFPFGGTNQNPDHSEINIDFFKKLDRIINYMNEQEIIAHIMIYVWNKNVNWPKSNSVEDNRYFDYVVKRYQGYDNIIWDISKEALMYGFEDMNYITSRIERIRQLDGHQRLVTVHDYKYCNQHPEKVDFISIQHYAPNLYDIMLQVGKDHPQKPVLNIEHGGYEKTMPYAIYNGGYTDPKTCLDRFYQCIFAGSYATYYWQNTSWFQIISDPTLLPEENQPSYQYYKHLSAFFDKYNYNELIPAQFGFSPYCLTNNNDLFIYYLPENLIKVVGSNATMEGKTVQLTWFNPYTGKYTLGETLKNQPPWQDFKRPESIGKDIVILIVEAL